MTKKEWLQALLDGKTMTSDEASGEPICFDSSGNFEYISSSGVYQEANVNNHETNLREYFEYPMWFECISERNDKGMIIRFDSLNSGVVVVDVRNGFFKKSKTSNTWTDHTDTSTWKQVPEPIIEVEEMTLEEVCKLIGKNIKIVKG